jgi:hypothetical protein
MKLTFDNLKVISEYGFVEFIDIPSGDEIFSLKSDEHFSEELLTSDAFKTLFCLIYTAAYNEGIVCGKSNLKRQIERVLDKCDC